MTRTMTLGMAGGLAVLAAVALGLAFMMWNGSRAGGFREDIRVHGNWQIDVLGPDGSLVSHTEFENALNSDGKVSLAQYLARETLVGGWGVGLSSNACDVRSTTTLFDNCYIHESSSTDPGTNVFKNLTISRSANTAVLSGTATAQNNGSITHVFTLSNRCLPSEGSGCWHPSTDVFTSTELTTPVTVTTGQQIQVTVTLSFS